MWRGRVWQPDRERFRRWLCRDVARRAGGQPVAMALEGCTGWRYVVEEIVAAGFEAHLAEPADTQTARGRKRHAKTDRSDARMLRELLQSGDLPVVDPADGRVGVARTGAALQVAGRSAAGVDPTDPPVVPHGVAVPEGAIRSTVTRDRLLGDDVDLTPAGRQRVRVGYSMLEATDVEAQSLKRDLQRFGHRQPACRALVEETYGIGGLIAVAGGPSSATVVASPGPSRWFVTAAWTSPSTPPTAIAPMAISPVRDRRRCGGRCSKQR